jgi:hypothetical protein
MVYDWSEEKEQICYRMYIEEKKSLEEIMEYMKEEHKFAPRYVRIGTFSTVYPTVRRPTTLRPILHNFCVSIDAVVMDCESQFGVLTISSCDVILFPNSREGTRGYLCDHHHGDDGEGF